MLILYKKKKKKGKRLQYRNEQSNNTTKKVTERGCRAVWFTQRRGVSHCKELHQLEIQAFPRHKFKVFSANSPTQMACSSFWGFSTDILVLSDDSLPALTSRKS